MNYAKTAKAVFWEVADMRYKLLIVGGGAAGLAAAVQAQSLGIEDICLCERSDSLGGILPQCIHKGFGHGYFKEDLSGPDYAERFQKALDPARMTLLLNTTVLSLSPDKSALLSSESGLRRVYFDHVILATGCRERAIGELPVSGSRPAGIFTAGSAQKMINLHHWDIGERIVILGSGDIGMIMARRLRLCGKQVIALIEQAPQLGGLERNRRQCIEEYQIPVMLQSRLLSLHGWPRLTAVTVESPQGQLRIDCDTLVVSVGLIPERELLQTLPDPLPPWLHLCGNCERVHEIVDAVSFQAEQCVKDIFLTAK